jgi:L-alanine-DL-glutamate epimerase-like enolase superfamily enzyme
VKITAVHVDTLELEYEEPFVIASSALTAGPCDLVRVETDEGLVGYGEACPAYEFTGDTLWTVQDVIGEYLGPSVIGKDPCQIEAIVHCWERELFTVGNQAAQAAVEMALWDLQGKALGRPLCDLIGGRTRDGLTEVIAWGWDEPEALAAKTREALALGITVFKIKVGDLPERDEQRVAAVREAAGSQARITVDANQGWLDAKTAVRAIKLLEPYDLEFVEQPVRMDDLEAARFVRDHVNVPIALDESVRGPREALAAAKAGACDMFVVKLMKTGGILNALKVNAIAEAAGISVMMGNMGESSLGLAAHFHVNVALANATHCDADLPWRPAGLRRDIGSGLAVELREGVSTVLVPVGPGLGIALDEEAVALQRVARRW